MQPKPGKVSKPQQERSRKTLDALLNATADLLDENSFPEVSISKIVTRASSSAGSFYARFEDKNALLHVLHQRTTEDIIVQTEELMSDLQGAKHPLDKVAGRIIDSIARMYFEHRGVIRAAMIEALIDVQYAHRAIGLMKKVSALIASVVAVEGISHEKLCQEIETGMITIAAIFEQQLFFYSALHEHQTPEGKSPTLDPDRLRRVFLATVNI